MAKRFEGQVVWVTGASRGIGRATALAFAREGAWVGLTARDERRLAGVAGEIRGEGGRAAVAPADLATRDGVRTAAAEVERALGSVEVLVNNAAVLRPGPVIESRPEDWDAMWTVNVMGPLHAVQAVVPGMVARGRGRVVMVSSVLGRRAMPRYGGYAATKFALMAMSEALRAELRGTGVSVTAVLPTGTDTDMNRQPGLPERVRKRAEAGRMMAPEAVAARIVDATARGMREATCSARSHAVLVAHRLAPGLLEAVLSGGWARR